MKKLISNEKLDYIAPILKTLSHPLRLKIINILEEGEKAVFEIVELIGVSQALTSHQLSIMKSAGIVKQRREKNYVYYSISQDHVYGLLECIRNCKVN